MYTAERQFFNYMNINILRNNAILRGENPLISSIFAGITIALCLLGIFMAHTTNADFVVNKEAAYVAKEVVKEVEKEVKAVDTINVVITAYSSTEDQTDDTPFTTASNKTVTDGIIANNMLPFGTKVRIPDLFGDKIFVVEDRMNRRKSDYHFDIWFPSRELAVNFGVKTAELEVLEN